MDHELAFPPTIMAGTNRGRTRGRAHRVFPNERFIPQGAIVRPAITYVQYCNGLEPGIVMRTSVNAVNCPKCERMLYPLFQFAAIETDIPPEAIQDHIWECRGEANRIIRMRRKGEEAELIFAYLLGKAGSDALWADWREERGSVPAGLERFQFEMLSGDNRRASIVWSDLYPDAPALFWRGEQAKSLARRLGWSS